jgi:hypothetical protein
MRSCERMWVARWEPREERSGLVVMVVNEDILAGWWDL